MNYKIFFYFLKKLSKRLNQFYKKNYKVRLKINNKSKNKKIFDPVTNFDKGFEKYIRKSINKDFPNDSIIGEEFSEKKTKSKFKWCIDPIDGTKAFLIGAPTWSNLIGLSYKNEPLMGLSNFPELEKVYINDKKNSYLLKNNKLSKIKSLKNTNLKKTKIIGNFHNSISFKSQQKIIEKLGWAFKFTSLDALNYCLLAEGKVDAVIEAKLKRYDILPLIPIIKKSGGVVSTWSDLPPENGGNILATSNIILHKKILKILRPFV